MHTILGAGGVIGNALAGILSGKGERVRLVGRNPKLINGAADVAAADLSNLQQTVDAVSGSSVAYLMAGLKYDVNVWQDLWPRIMSNAIEACKRANAKLVFFDNVYMYGKVNGPMTEQTPFNPCSRKGEIRARIASMLLDEAKSGRLTALIARSADFYGPDGRNSVPQILVFDKLAKGKRPAWLVNDAVKHSFTYGPDAALGVATLAASPAAWNQTWHLPTAPDPPTGKEFIAMAAAAFGQPPKHTVLTKWMLRLAGIADGTVRESYEMLYQSDHEYIFDSSRFGKAFKFQPTSYDEGIRQTAAATKGG